MHPLTLRLRKHTPFLPHLRKSTQMGRNYVGTRNLRIPRWPRFD